MNLVGHKSITEAAALMGLDRLTLVTGLEKHGLLIPSQLFAPEPTEKGKAVGIHRFRSPDSEIYELFLEDNLMKKTVAVNQKKRRISW
jgi:hypothetical protein